MNETFSFTAEIEIPPSREIHLTLPEDMPTGAAKISIVIAEHGINRRIRTLGELLNSELFGLWRDRTDIRDSVEFARQLRRDAWQRTA
jgi:hypothetical protein